MTRPPTVLVTDAENKNALAAVRSLGTHGARVIVGSTRKRLARGFYSRYAAARVTYPSPESEADFVDAVLEIVDSHGVDVVLPIGDATNRVTSRHLDRFTGRVAIPVAPWRSMQIAASKELTMPFAQERGLDVPHVFASRAEVDRFPVVVKRSSGAGGVRYVNGPDELEAAEVSGAIIQDWIPGEGFGYFALFDRGRERASFMHRRVREYPVTGGSSTAAESFRDAELARLGRELLSALDWHGVAMVEFKRDVRDGRFKLMEINPKFWGSLDLSIAAGVDFPWLTTQMALGEDYAADPDFRAGLRFQWVFDDVLHAAARPSAAGEVWRDLRDGAVRHDIWPHDLRPSAFDLARTVAVIVGRAARGRLRRPHGQVGPLAQAPSN